MLVRKEWTFMTNSESLHKILNVPAVITLSTPGRKKHTQSECCDRKVPRRMRWLSPDYFRCSAREEAKPPRVKPVSASHEHKEPWSVVGCDLDHPCLSRRNGAPVDLRR